jgi:hypothetical protein
MPEAGVPLAQLVTYLSASPKSNAAYTGYGEAVREVRQGDNPGVPHHIRNAPTKLMKDLGYGRGYQYAHDFEDQTAAMECLPDALAGRRFYEPKDAGFEKEMKERLERMREARYEESITLSRAATLRSHTNKTNRPASSRMSTTPRQVVTPLIFDCCSSVGNISRDPFTKYATSSTRSPATTIIIAATATAAARRAMRPGLTISP